MLVSLCVLLLVSSVLSLPVGDKDLDTQFEEWKKKFERVYSGPEEEAMRRGLWEKNLRIVEAHNKEADQGKHTWWMGMNHFSDWTDEEFGKMSCVRPRIDHDVETNNVNVTAGDAEADRNGTAIVPLGSAM